jgi:hypothetical protein
MKITVLIAFVPIELLNSGSKKYEYMPYSSETFEIKREDIYKYLVEKYNLSTTENVDKQPLNIILQLICNKIAEESNSLGVNKGVYECKITEDNKHYYSDGCCWLQTFVDNRNYE